MSINPSGLYSPEKVIILRRISDESNMIVFPPVECISGIPRQIDRDTDALTAPGTTFVSLYGSFDEITVF